jgi:hypothetical protein
MGLFRGRRATPRPPAADLETATVDVDGRSMPLREVLLAARVVGTGLSVIVHHPDFELLLEEPRAEAAYEVLVATLGEAVLRGTVVELSPATYPPIDPFGPEQLRAFVRSLGITIELPPETPPE